jgi:hypothetical protein
MSYYPLSQIKTNIYSNGELSTISGELYTGYYWKTSKGQFFSGRTPQDTPSQELFLTQNPLSPGPLPSPPGTGNVLSPINELATFPNDPDPPIPPKYQPTSIILDDYNTLKPFSNNGSIPYYSPTYPTPQDYQVGEFRRFFCKKTNEIQYIEIDPKQYSLISYKDPQILWQLYYPFNIPWVISGQEESTLRINENMVALTMKQLKLPRFNDYLQNDYLKYFI